MEYKVIEGLAREVEKRLNNLKKEHDIEITGMSTSNSIITVIVEVHFKSKK